MTSILKVVAVAAEMLNPDPAAVEVHNQATLTAHETHGNLAIEMTSADIKNNITKTVPIINFSDAVVGNENPANLSKEPGIEPDPEPQGVYLEPNFEGNRENLKKARNILAEYDKKDVFTWAQSDFGWVRLDWSHDKPSKEEIMAVTNYKKILDKYQFMIFYFDYATKNNSKEMHKYDSGRTRKHYHDLQSYNLEQKIGLEYILSELKLILNPPEQVLIPEADKIGVCTLDNKSAEVLAAEKRMGIEITTQIYTSTYTGYIIARNGEKIVKFTSDNDGSMKSYEIYVDEEGSLIFDKIKTKDGLHWYTKFRENNGVIEEWSKYPTSDWKMVAAEIPMPAIKTSSLQE